MRFGAMNNPMVDVTEEIASFGDIGFDFIDLTLEPQQTYSASVDTDKIVSALDRAGMFAVGHTAWYLPIASPFPEFRELALKELDRCMTVLKDMGVGKMNVHPHTHVSLYDEDWIIAQNTDAIARLADRAQELDMTVLVENMPGFSRVSQMKPLLETVTTAKLLLDVGHANLDTPYNRSEELLANFGHRLGHVHISDNRGGHDDQHLPLGVGNINWLQVVRFIKNTGYDDTITLEVFGDDDDYLKMSLRKIKYLWENTEPGETPRAPG
jgi:sugar phosphate isomerase/epimerase